MGGRIATHVAAADPDLPVAGLVLLGYPLHPPGRPTERRDAHLGDVRRPMLIVQGSRDTFGTPAEFDSLMGRLSPAPTLHVVEGGDHSFKIGRGGKAAQERVLRRRSTDDCRLDRARSGEPNEKRRGHPTEISGPFVTAVERRQHHIRSRRTEPRFVVGKLLRRVPIVPLSTANQRLRDACERRRSRVRVARRRRGRRSRWSDGGRAPRHEKPWPRPVRSRRRRAWCRRPTRGARHRSPPRRTSRLSGIIRSRFCRVIQLATTSRDRPR